MNLDWTWHKGHISAGVMIDRDLTNTNSGRHTLDRLRNALNAFGTTSPLILSPADAS